MSERYGIKNLCVKKMTVLNEDGAPAVFKYSNGILTVIEGGIYTANFYLERFPETQSSTFEIDVPVIVTEIHF
jgi:hypothetical protein